MKQILSIIFIALLFLSCEENERVITPIVPSGERVILLEEFTGKGCSNCPKGSRELDNLISLFGENIVVVSIHAGFFADPDIFEIGQYDLRTDEGEALFDYLGPNSGYPAGVINRSPFNGDLQLSANAWASVITSELDKAPTLDFNITTQLNQNTRELAVNVNGLMRETVDGDIRVSIMLAESGIIDAQDDVENGGIVEDYEHKHVLRDMMTKFDGETISELLLQGDEINLNYSTTLDEAWDPNKMDVIVFFSNVEDGTFTVLQANEAHIIE